MNDLKMDEKRDKKNTPYALKLSQNGPKSDEKEALIESKRPENACFVPLAILPFYAENGLSRRGVIPTANLTSCERRGGPTPFDPYVNHAPGPAGRAEAGFTSPRGCRAGRNSIL